MRKYLLLLAAAALVATAAPAKAGYYATFGPTTVDTPDSNSNGMADVGETFATSFVAPRGTTSGTFNSFIADPGPGQPTISNADLGLYGFELLGVASAVSGTDVTYTGTYAIRYYDPSTTIYDVSTGTFNILADFSLGDGFANFSGVLNQTGGPPAGGPWVDLASYGPVTISGIYNPTVPGQQGVITGAINGSLVIPEPGSMALLAMGALPLLGLRRRK